MDIHIKIIGFERNYNAKMNYSTSKQIKAAIERSFTSFKTNLDTIYNTTYNIIMAQWEIIKQDKIA